MMLCKTSCQKCWTTCFFITCNGHTTGKIFTFAKVKANKPAIRKVDNKNNAVEKEN